MNIIKLTPDERVDLEIFFVLQKIKKYNRYRTGKDNIAYHIYSPPDLSAEGMHFPVEELKIIDLLVNNKVIERKDPEGGIEEAEVSLSNGLRVITAIIYLEFLPEFEKTYQTYQDKSKEIMAKISGLEEERKGRELEAKTEGSREAPEAIDMAQEGKNNLRLYCDIKRGVGYLRIGKSGKPIWSGGEETRTFRFIRFITENLGMEKSIDSIFDVIKLPKDENNPQISSYDIGENTKAKAKIISWQIKEIQQIDSLRGLIKFSFGPGKRTLKCEWR